MKNENKMSRKEMRQIKRHLHKQNKKEFVKRFNDSYDSKKFYDSEEGQEFMNNFMKLFIERML